MLRFTPVHLATHRAAIVDVNVEYLSWVARETDAWFGIDTEALLGGSIRDYVEGTIEKVCTSQPGGVYYLLQREGDDLDDVVGMGALRALRPGVGEVKRMYIRDAWRGRGYARALLARLLSDAAGFGHETLMLDSGPFMTAAHGLYRAHSFVERDAYAETEVPELLRGDWKFMERSVRGP